MRNAVALVLTILNKLVPKDGRVLVAGSPAGEPGVVEALRAIAALDPGVTVWWMNCPSGSFRRSVGLQDAAIVAVPERSLRGVWAFLRAGTVIFSHGVLGCPAPGRGQVVVNLWHGEAVKGGGPFFPHRWRWLGPSSTYVVGGSRTLGPRKLELADLPDEALLLLGNPCTDAFRRPLSDEQREALGIAPDRPFVVWMPTFRRAKTSDGTLAWSNTTDEQADDALAKRVSTLAGELRARGIEVLVKPHPMDLVARDVDGSRTVTNEQLEAWNIPLYQLLGASSGLVSDYSSVWIDYILCDRPIGVFAPDLTEFQAGRGPSLPVIQEVISELRIDESREAMGRFADDVLAGGALSRDLRRDIEERLGMVRSEEPAAQALVNLLQNRG